MECSVALNLAQLHFKSARVVHGTSSHHALPRTSRATRAYTNNKMQHRNLDLPKSTGHGHVTRRVRTTWAECVGDEIYVKRRRRRPNRRYLDIVNKDTQDVGARLMFDNVFLENALWRPLM